MASAYSNLEMDLSRKERGSRYAHVDGLLRRLSGAEAVLVVNNCASAVLLALDATVTAQGPTDERAVRVAVEQVLRAQHRLHAEVGDTLVVHDDDAVA